MSVDQKDGVTCIELNHQKHIYKCTIEEYNDTIVFEVSGIDSKDVVFISHLKKICYKATYCVHCEVCEVEYPLTIVYAVTKNRGLRRSVSRCNRSVDQIGLEPMTSRL